MKPERKIKELIGKSDVTTNPRTKERILGEALGSLRNMGQKKTQSAQPEPNIGRAIMKSKTIRLTAAAVIILAVVGGMTFWPSRSSDGKKWWLAPPAAWSQEILTALDEVKVVTCRERIVSYDDIGTEHISMTWDILYVSRDSKRKDIYDRDFLREIQWYVPDGDGTRHHSIRFDLKSYFTRTYENSGGDNDPVDSLRSRVSLLDEADSQLGTKVIDGCECVGFEISASKYGNNPAERTDCIWFDVETKLPVRIERHGVPITDSPDETVTIVQDQFDYNPVLSADTFVPYTPEGFVFGHPDDIQSTRKATQQ